MLIWQHNVSDPENPGEPVGILRISELTFNYTLSFDLASKQAIITTNYVIGQPSDLWLVDGSYYTNDPSNDNYNLTAILTEQGLSLAIANFQLTVVLDSTGAEIGSNAITSDGTPLSNTSENVNVTTCLLYTSPSPRDLSTSRMPSSA